VFLVQDKKINCQVKAWVTVMNLYRPALAHLCNPAFYEAPRDTALKLRDDLFALKDLSLSAMKDPSNKVMPIYETVKTIALSFLSPDPNRKDRERRMPTEARVDTGPDSFTLGNIPRDHPDLKLLELETIGIGLAESLCLLLDGITGVTVDSNGARNSRPIINSLQILAVYRPSVRKLVIDNLIKNAQLVKDDSENVHKLGVQQSLSTNLLELLKEDVIRQEWRAAICDALELVGGSDQATKLLSEVDKKENEETRKRQRAEEREEMSTIVRTDINVVLEACDAEHLRQNFDYPPHQSQWTPEFISTIHDLPSKDVAELVVMNMNNLPGPPPFRTTVIENRNPIRTFAQFALLIDGAISSMAAVPSSRKFAKTSIHLKGRSKAPGDIASAMTPLDTIEPRKMAFEQMLKLHAGHSASSSLELFSSLSFTPSSGDVIIARTACNYQQDDAQFDLRPTLIEYIAGDLGSRLGLALSTFSHIYSYSVLTTSLFDDYDAFFMSLVRLLFSSEKQLPQKAISRLFTSAPRLPAYAISILTSFCTDKTHRVLGLSTLRDVILYRQASKDVCLDYALFFAVHKEEWIRDSAVRLVRHQLYPNPMLVGDIQSFAQAMLNSCLLEDHSKDPDVLSETKLNEGKKEFLGRFGEIEFVSAAVEDEEEETKTDTVETDADFKRRLSLFIALCTQDQNLLKDYMNTFAKAKDEVLKTVMQEMISKLIEMFGKTLGPAAALALFQGFSDGAVPLVTAALKLLVSELISDSKEKRSELVTQAKLMHDESNEYNLFDVNDKFVIPVLGCLDKVEVESYLIGILAMDSGSIRDAITSVLLASRFANQEDDEDEEEEINFLPPDKLLLFFVNQKVSEDITTACLLEATDICFERKDLYTKDVLVSVITSLLIQEGELPPLTMRVLIKSMDIQPKIKPFIGEALANLFEREVWTNPTLFEGWLLCATLLETQAYPIVLRLPVEHLKFALDFSKTNKWNLHSRVVYYSRNNAKSLNLSEETLALLFNFN